MKRQVTGSTAVHIVLGLIVSFLLGCRTTSSDTNDPDRYSDPPTTLPGQTGTPPSISPSG